MRFNSRIVARRIGNTSMILASAVLLSVPSAMAQMSPAGSAQQSSPTQQTPSAAQPGMSPLDQADNDSQMSKETAQALDKAFVKKALEGGMAEVQLGQIALQKSNNGEVKQFAQKMVDDHTKLGDQMKEVAQKLNVKVPDSVSSKDKALMAKLQALNGDSFDQAYIKDMVKDHKQDDNDFKSEAQRASDPDLKQVAMQGEQVISQHLQMIQQIAQKNNIASK
jgi:putative membrane protein